MFDLDGGWWGVAVGTLGRWDVGTLKADFYKKIRKTMPKIFWRKENFLQHCCIYNIRFIVLHLRTVN